MEDRELTTHKKQELTGNEQTRPGRTFLPDVDIYETPDSLWLRADMPGVDEQSIEINVNDGVLSIEGQVEVKDYENLAPIQRSMEFAAHGGQAINYQERRIWHVQAWIDKVIGPERIPEHLRVPDLLDAWVEHP